MQVSYSEGLANHTGPEFMRRYSQIRKQPEAGGLPCDIVAVSEAGENAVGRHATVRSRPADGQTQCRLKRARRQAFH